MISICIAVGPAEKFPSLKHTIDSVVIQTAHPIELVIKTFGNHLNKDISDYALDNPQIHLKLLVGSDMGIYDAFNICAQAARGKYVIFLGCGDCLADCFVVEDIIGYATNQNFPDIIYGAVVLANSAGSIVATFNNNCFFGNALRFPWRNPCHSQGLIYKQNWLTGHLFEIDIGPLSDLVHTYQNRVFEKASWIGRPISIFKAGGVSNKRGYRAFTARLNGVYRNCEYFRFPYFWRLISTLVCQISYAFGR